MAAEIAPFDVANQPEKWRFVATLRGKIVVEKWTRAGRFRVEMPDFKAVVAPSANFYNVELKIPLRELPQQFRLSAMRRTSAPATGTRVVTRAFSDAGDPFLMPKNF